MKNLLLASLLGLGACGGLGNDPAPAPPVTPEAKTHTLELSYWLASYGDASQLPATAPVITVVLRAVQPGPSGFAVYQPEQTLLRVQDVSTVVKTVKLPDVTTYSPGQTTLLLATVTVPAAPSMGLRLGYYVKGYYTIDGVPNASQALFYDAYYADNMETPLTYTTEFKLRH